MISSDSCSPSSLLQLSGTTCCSDVFHCVRSCCVILCCENSLSRSLWGLTYEKPPAPSWPSGKACFPYASVPRLTLLGPYTDPSAPHLPPITPILKLAHSWPLWPGWAVEKSPGPKQCILHTAYFLCLSVARRVGRWGVYGHRGADLRILGQESDRDCQAETSV